jgi:hypothetical protein
LKPCTYCGGVVEQVIPQYKPGLVKADYFECQDCGFGKWVEEGDKE